MAALDQQWPGAAGSLLCDLSQVPTPARCRQRHLWLGFGVEISPAEAGFAVADLDEALAVAIEARARDFVRDGMGDVLRRDVGLPVCEDPGFRQRFAECQRDRDNVARLRRRSANVSARCGDRRPSTRFHSSDHCHERPSEPGGADVRQQVEVDLSAVGKRQSLPIGIHGRHPMLRVIGDAFRGEELCHRAGDVGTRDAHGRRFGGIDLDLHAIARTLSAEPIVNEHRAFVRLRRAVVGRRSGQHDDPTGVQTLQGTPQ